MKLGIAALESLPYSTRVAMEDLQVQVSAGWSQQHDGNGGHLDIVGTSLDVGAGAMSGGALALAGQLQVDDAGIVSPAQITANQNNYNPTGLAAALVLRLQTDASRTLTGLTIVDQGADRFVLLVNVGNFNLVLAHNSGSSSAVNRFGTPQGLSFTLASGESVWLLWDKNSAVWRVCARNKGMWINSIQRGTIEFVSGGGNTPTATITAVDTSLSELRNLGIRNETGALTCELQLTNSTTITATRYNALNALNGIVSYEITEWANG